MLLQVDFESFKTHAVSSLPLLFCAWGSRCEHLAFCFFAFPLPWWTLTPWNSQIKQSLLSHGVFIVIERILGTRQAFIYYLFTSVICNLL